MKIYSIYTIFLLLLVSSLAQAQDSPTPLTILFTNDVHGKTEPCG